MYVQQIHYVGNNGTNISMPGWFDHLAESKIDTPRDWYQDKLIWDYRKVWSDKNLVEKHMNELWKDASIGER